MQGRFLIQNYFTSLNPQAAIIHVIDHSKTELRPSDAGGVMTVRIPALCGATVSPKFLALLGDADVNLWIHDLGLLVGKYGPREMCRWCK